MDIRLMNSSDYDAAVDLWKNTVGMGINEIDDSRAGIEKFLNRNPNTCFVAEENGKLIGTILCGHDGRRAFIYHTAVIGHMRGNGVGKTLVETAVTALKNEGITKAALVVIRSNQPGNAFWERMGFVERPDLVYRNKSLF